MKLFEVYIFRQVQKNQLNPIFTVLGTPSNGICESTGAGVFEP